MAGYSAVTESKTSRVSKTRGPPPPFLGSDSAWSYYFRAGGEGGGLIGGVLANFGECDFREDVTFGSLNLGC